MDLAAVIWSDLSLGLEWLLAELRKIPVDALLLALAWASVVSLIAFMWLSRTNKELRRKLKARDHKYAELRMKYEAEILRSIREPQLPLPLIDAPETAPGFKRESQPSPPA